MEIYTNGKDRLFRQSRRPAGYVAHFADGSVSPVTDVRWSPEFMTGLAHRGDGKCRCVFFGQNDGAMLQEDAWVHRVERKEA
jgi:hypothetical protein